MMLKIVSDKLGLIIVIHGGLFVVRIRWEEIEETKGGDLNVH